VHALRGQKIRAEQDQSADEILLHIHPPWKTNTTKTAAKARTDLNFRGSEVH
jgi:hypothetical protein